MRWVADYRDLWFQEFAIQRYAFTTWLTGFLNRNMLRRAAAVVTVSEGLADYLKPIVRCPVWVCYNGYLTKSAAHDQRPWSDSRRHIVYTGNFYPQKRDPRVLFAAMASLFLRRPELREQMRLDIYGPSEGWVRAYVDEFGLDDVVIEHGMQPYAVSLHAQASADALLFVDWMDPAAKGVLTGKLFEYLASERPILNISQSETTEASQIIALAGAGRALIGLDATIFALEAFVDGKIEMTTSSDALAQFSRRKQADLLLQRLEELVCGNVDASSERTGQAHPILLGR